MSERPLAAADTPVSVIDALRDAWNGGDIECALGLCHPRIDITEIDALLPGHETSFQGHDGARRWLELINEVWDVEFRVEPRERRVLDDRSIEVLSDVTARSSGNPPGFSASTRSVWQFEEGKLRRVRFSVDAATAEDAPRA